MASNNSPANSSSKRASSDTLSSSDTTATLKAKPQQGPPAVESSAPESEPVSLRESRDYTALQQALGYTFQTRLSLEGALTHRSLQAKSGESDYERLEFLGDAVLDLAIAHLLLEHHPSAHEGVLSKMRAALVNTQSLAEIAKTIELGQYVRLSRGELANGGAERPSILADVVEALMGAIYREAGFQTALRCPELLFGERIRTVTPRDPKTELQEVLHALGKEPPVYLLECVEGPEHAPNFISIVHVGGQFMGRGRGATKKASQQAAAAEALEQLSPLRAKLAEPAKDAEQTPCDSDALQSTEK